jgi:alkylation response protein AidB-like acyl-CoA dehydrogenase
MAVTVQERAEQIKQAEEILFSDPQRLGFANGLFFGHFNAELIYPFPELKPEERESVARAEAEVRRFTEEEMDAAAIDRNAEIPLEVVAGLAKIGVLGMTAPVEYGGRGMSQLGYCRLMEIIGGRCASTAVFVNAHHSIGIRALLLYGTEEQKRRYLPDLVTGRGLAAFALTEPEAGSDAANVQTKATPTSDGKTYILSGQKRYITNGGLAQVLTVMARTPVPGSNETKVSAFIVTPDMPGFEVVEARMEKVGIRGTATARLAFHEMPVPAENLLGQLGRGLQIALSVLNYGRITFGASCTGAAKVCLRAASNHARKRVQFKQTLSEFEMVKEKIAYMAAHAFAMAATVAQGAALIDRGADIKLETAMLKVWSTEALWKIVNDTIQIFGGQAFFCNEPYERMMRDARLNSIGEGANDVLRAFIAMVGMKPVIDQLLGVRNALSNPFKGLGTLLSFGKKQIGARLTTPEVPVRHAELRPHAQELGKCLGDFGLAVQRELFRYREDIVDRQYVLERIADSACELYASGCTLSQLEHQLTVGNGNPTQFRRDLLAGKYFLRLSNRRIRQSLAALTDNDDEQTTATANAFLEKGSHG